MPNSQVLTESLRKLKIASLNDIATLIGAPIPAPTKTARIQGLSSQFHFYQQQYAPLAKLNTLALDLGIKNFSYCKSSSSGHAWPVHITKWDKFSLHERYNATNTNNNGPLYQPLLHPDSMVDKYRLFSHLTSRLVSDIKPEIANVRVMEVQRTRSNLNSATLPSILQVHDLEMLLIGRIYPELVIPVTSHRMMNFWLYKYIAPEVAPSMKRNTKIVRRELAFAWFGTLYRFAPSFLADLGVNNEDNDKSGGVLNKRTLLGLMKLDSSDKTDDLVDSLLYNLYINAQFMNLASFTRIFEQGGTSDDILSLIDEKTRFHRDLIRPVMDKFGFVYKEDKKK
ncbi:uncharacterized protein LODBEIA_P09500 [Lodderomyces beijingensis]|uniref:Mitochondrial resolvase Ydc2 catalytic domain-containing protein n=1 Tax=Lodderomyces beijingensis TaxID=1775926 RepID=A0ABP0ZHZ1_9ASCO